MVALAATLVVVTFVSTRTADAASAQALDRAAHLVTVLLDGREQSLARAAAVFVQNPIFRSLVIGENADDVRDQALEGAERTGATWAQIVNARGERLARSDDPTAPRVSLAASALIARALGGEVATGFGASADSTLLQVVAVPIEVPSTNGKQTIGAFMAAQMIDSLLAAKVREATATDVVFYVSDASQAPHVSVSTLGVSPSVQALVVRATGQQSPQSGDSVARFDVELNGAEFVGRSVVVRSAGGDPLGGFLALRARDAELAPFISLRRWIFLAGFLSLVLGAGIAYLVARSIAGPVLDIAAATRRAADGDYDADISFESTDEIGQLAAAVRTMLADLREKRALVELLQTAPSGTTPHVDTLPRSGGSAIQPGNVVANRYEIRSALGSGGAGVVYMAFDRELSEVVALKTLHPETIERDPTALERLKSEIRLARRIAHRGVVRTFDLGESDGTYFLTMEYVAGTPLSDLLARDGRLPVPAIFSIARQLARALEVAHEQGIIHRDIKPQNIMVQPDGTLKVMDFGIARLTTRVSAMTQVGMIVGTPGYMAPEQLLDGDVDARADLYACGAVIYECITGRLPHDASNPVALIGRLMTGATVTPPREMVPTVPHALSALVMRLLSLDSATRTASASALHDELLAAEAER